MKVARVLALLLLSLVALLVMTANARGEEPRGLRLPPSASNSFRRPSL